MLSGTSAERFAAGAIQSRNGRAVLARSHSQLGGGEIIIYYYLNKLEDK